MHKLDLHRQQTLQELKTLLATNNRVAVVRPTGYGKTHLVHSLCSTSKGKKLIIVPLNTIIDYMDQYFSQDKNVGLGTYQKLVTFKSEDDVRSFFGDDLRYIFLDEAHHISANKWAKGVSLLLSTYPNAKVVGLTATPLRTDGRDVVNGIFQGVQVAPMTLLDAIAEKLLIAPIYVSALYTLKEELDKRAMQIKESKKLSDADKQERLQQLNDVYFNIKKLKNIPSILRKHLSSHPASTQNMKFIVFCSSIEVLQTAEKTVKRWFDKAFPDKYINVFSIHSGLEDLNTGKEVGDFELVRGSKYIDLMFAVNMINEGLHISNVTGAVFLRKTSSHVLYLQQIGRTISAVGEHQPIIFDFVNNHRQVKSGYIKELSSSINALPGNTKRDREKKKHLKSALISVYDEVSEVVDILDRLLKDLSDTWTSEEDSVISQYYSSKGAKGVATMLNSRSVKAIFNRAQILGVRSTMGPYQPWEDDILRAFYPTEGVKGVLNHGVGRPEGSISMRARLLGLTFSGSIRFSSNRYNNAWKPWEDDILRKFYPSGGIEVVKENGVNRPDGSISSRASRLKVRFGTQVQASWSDWEDGVVRKFYPSGGSRAVQQNGVARSIDSIKRRASKLGIEFNTRVQSFWSDWEDDIIRKFYPSGGSRAVQQNGVNKVMSSISSRASKLGVSFNK